MSDPAADQLDAVAVELAKRFIARKDAKAVQHSNGSYSPARKANGELIPWTMGDLRKHLRGEVSFGHYLVSKSNTSKLFALDIDLDKQSSKINSSPRTVWAGGESEDKCRYRKQLRALGEGLAWRAQRLLGIDMAVSYSGSKGVHVYGFTGEIEAAEARQVALDLLGTFVFKQVNGTNFWKHEYFYEDLTVEVFPKQASIGGDGFGNLMRLPLGRNAKGGESFFLDSTAPIDQMLPMDPIEALLKGTLRNG